jgi:hypothetical protein
VAAVIIHPPSNRLLARRLALLTSVPQLRWAPRVTTAVLVAGKSVFCVDGLFVEGVGHRLPACRVAIKAQKASLVPDVLGIDTLWRRMITECFPSSSGRLPDELAGEVGPSSGVHPCRTSGASMIGNAHGSGQGAG